MNDSYSVVSALVTVAAALCVMLVEQPPDALACVLTVAALWI